MGYAKVSNTETHIDRVKIEQKLDLDPVISSLDKIHKHLLRHNAIINVPDNVPTVEVKPDIRVEVPPQEITITAPAVNNINPSGKYLAAGVWCAVFVRIVEIVAKHWSDIEAVIK